MKNTKYKKIIRRFLLVLITVFLVVFVLYKNGLIGDLRIFRGLKAQYVDLSKKTTNIILEKIYSITGNASKPGPLTFGEYVNLDKKTYLTKVAIVSLSNKERLSFGLETLKENKKLNLSAEKKLQDIFTNQYFEHDSPTGVKIENLANDVGYKNILIGENLALGNFKNESELVKAWMNSKGHRANILNKKYTEIGVAVGRGLFKGKEVWVAVQHFGTPADVCPIVNESLHEQVLENQNKINEIGEKIEYSYKGLPRAAFGGGFIEGKALDEYNNMVSVYNYLLEENKIKTETYNSQVKSFNECIVKYQ